MGVITAMALTLALATAPWGTAPVAVELKENAATKAKEKESVPGEEWKKLLGEMGRAVPKGPWKKLISALRKQIPETLPKITSETEITKEVEALLNEVQPFTVAKLKKPNEATKQKKRKYTKTVEDLLEIISKYHPAQ